MLRFVQKNWKTLSQFYSDKWDIDIKEHSFSDLFLGAGEFGCVFKASDNRIIKFTEDEAEMKLVDLLHNSDSTGYAVPTIEFTHYIKSHNIYAYVREDLNIGVSLPDSHPLLRIKDEFLWFCLEIMPQLRNFDEYNKAIRTLLCGKYFFNPSPSSDYFDAVDTIKKLAIDDRILYIDIQPDNLAISSEGKIILADLGGCVMVDDCI